MTARCKPNRPSPLSVPIIGDGVDKTSTRAMLTLRNELLPATIGKVA